MHNDCIPSDLEVGSWHRKRSPGVWEIQGIHLEKSWFWLFLKDITNLTFPKHGKNLYNLKIPTVFIMFLDVVSDHYSHSAVREKHSSDACFPTYFLPSFLPPSIPFFPPSFLSSSLSFLLSVHLCVLLQCY